MDEFLTAIALIIGLNAFICLYRAAVGPTTQDRVLGVNIVGTKTLVVVILVTYILAENYFLDVAIVYALLLFVVTVALSRYLEAEGWKEVP
ncbi:monovalent cation/H+ antiporter complex subunit F [Candidatus Solincola tengchongensis]|uniref:monovalent cation/H+ antiporter complex subunit F n=1 Tax=Candidatus Solincola tengchongensis TaxID=2900693 RepID=UPI00257ECF6C|nr:monovalent cation/H+ antiporter complex subunit F [Candidatus Solincola tengchongensis]